MGEPLLNADGKPPGGLACDSFGLSRGSVIEPFEPQRANLVVTRRPSVGSMDGRTSPNLDLQERAE